MRVVIIGGVAGGMSCATRLRRLDADAEIIVLERSGHVSYANCGLPYFVGGIIEDEADLLLQTPQSLHERFALDVRVGSDVTAIRATQKEVEVTELASGTTYSLAYDRLVLSPGASPVIPPIAGIERAYPLRTVEDVERMTRVVESHPRSAVVIGGGFIGLEISENLRHRGIDTTIVEATSQVLAPLDPEMAQLVVEELERHGVEVILGTSVVGITEGDVELADGRRVPGDVVIVAIGVRPDVHLARDAGLVIGPRGGVTVDGFNRTSDPAIYAIGDAAEKTDALDGSATLVPLANIANRQGRVVADHIAGRDVRVIPTIGTAIVKVFDLVIATTGWNEKKLRDAGRALAMVHSHPGSHAGYYPGAERMALKLIFDPVTGEILGAQGVGGVGVDKRIDVLATAIRGGITAPELADLELAYAPPFGSAKDPVNMLGYMAENVLSGLCEPVQWNEVRDYQARGYALIDVRTADEFDRGHIPGALNIPLDELRDRLDELPSDHVIVTCQVGVRGHTATLLLGERGVDAKNLDGGLQTWAHSPAAHEIVKDAPASMRRG
jgi:NADPH-dependent 2,4-dienoyl-CoA reductase/sulfur reductase-like enzyme/rhodanese-related sulfurtransferase